jgi:hypothetical protein
MPGLLDLSAIIWRFRAKWSHREAPKVNAYLAEAFALESLARRQRLRFGALLPAGAPCDAVSGGLGTQTLAD